MDARDRIPGFGVAWRQPVIRRTLGIRHVFASEESFLYRMQSRRHMSTFEQPL